MVTLFEAISILVKEQSCWANYDLVFDAGNRWVFCWMNKNDFVYPGNYPYCVMKESGLIKMDITPNFRKWRLDDVEEFKKGEKLPHAFVAYLTKFPDSNNIYVNEVDSGDPRSIMNICCRKLEELSGSAIYAYGQSYDDMPGIVKFTSKPDFEIIRNCPEKSPHAGALEIVLCKEWDNFVKALFVKVDVSDIA